MSQPVVPEAAALPARGRAKTDVLAAMEAARREDTRWRDGRAFSMVYYAGEDILDLLKEAYTLFFSENGLNPTAFPSLRKFETEVVSMTARLLGGDADVVGNMTAGGTDSILAAVKTARDWASVHRPQAVKPEIILPETAHPAFDKAAHYFGLRVVRTALDAGFRADPAAVASAVTANTALIVGSAPSYPHGVIDPIPALAEIARSHGILCHVDACVGGFVLPFAEKLGYPVPPFDFRVPGVTSMSADLHKYGYAAKGASVVLYRDAELRKHQFFVTTGWPGGIYASPALAGTRPGGAIAAAWAVMNYLGEEGYLRIVDTMMRTASELRAGIAGIPGLRVLGAPDMCVMAIGGEGVDVYEVGDEMQARGWHLDRQQFPPSLHLTVTYGHAGVVAPFLADLRESAKAARRPTLRKLINRVTLGLVRLVTRLLPAATVSRLAQRAGSGAGSSLSGRSAPMYGMMAALPNRGDVDQIVLDALDGMTRVSPRQP
jgi:glutamate/tyrosine decarboxylase-like PLP-dependent enzyme